MHRSGTSAVTRLISLLGLHTPPAADLVQPTEKNPKGYWESESLVAFNERLLWAIDCDIGCPVVLEPGWENDARLDPLRADARAVVREIFPVAPWVWKDPRHCLAFAFWRSVLEVKPVVVLVNRNPLEITASALRLRREHGKIYVDRGAHDRRARAHAVLVGAGVPARQPADDDVLAFIDTTLRHATFDHGDLLRDPDVSDAQRALFSALNEMDGTHPSFSPNLLPPETPTTEALLRERRRALELKRQLELERRSSWRWRIRSSRYAAPARPIYLGGRRLFKALQGR